MITGTSCILEFPVELVFELVLVNIVNMAATILDKMLEHGSQDRATLPLPPCNVGLENPNEISCRLCLTTIPLQGEGSGKGWWCFNDFFQ